MDYKVFSTELAGRPLTIEFGKYAQQANGSAFVRYGDTVVMVNAIFIWNEFVFANTFVLTEGLKTIPLGLQKSFFRRARERP